MSQYFVNSGELSDGGPGFTVGTRGRTGMAIPDSWRDPELKLLP